MPKISRPLLLFVLVAPILLTTVALAQVRVKGYYRSNGTYVQPHYRSSPNSTVTDNYSFYGNTNPYTGKVGTNRYYNSPTSPYYRGSSSYTLPSYTPPSYTIHDYTYPTYTYPSYTPPVETRAQWRARTKDGALDGHGGQGEYGGAPPAYTIPPAPVPLTLLLNGLPLVLPQPSFVHQGTAWVPARGVLTAAGYPVEYVADRNCVVISGCTPPATIYLNTGEVALGDETKTLDTPPRHSSGTLYLPAKFFRLIGIDVQWHGATNTLSLYTY